MISVESLKVEFGTRPLFEDVSFVINKKDRIALVGKNGAGKSTLLKILAAQQQPTSGSVSVQNDISIGYLPQVMVLSDNHTVIEETEKAFSHIQELKEKVDTLNEELLNRTDYESESYMELVERFTHENERFQIIGGMNYRAEMERTLQGLGFATSDFNRPTKEFSGGWRMRIELAKLLLQRPDVLLLDEPTNHIDIFTLEALESVLCEYAGTLLVISHDRRFVEKIATRLVFFHGHSLETFEGTLGEWQARQNRADEPDVDLAILEMRMAEITAKISTGKFDRTVLDEEYEALSQKRQALLKGD